jgi:hypothetical protein
MLEDVAVRQCLTLDPLPALQLQGTLVLAMDSGVYAFLRPIALRTKQRSPAVRSYKRSRMQCRRDAVRCHAVVGLAISLRCFLPSGWALELGTAAPPRAGAAAWPLRAAPARGRPCPWRLVPSTVAAAAAASSASTST